ncbi:MAG: DUF4199 domain-containing protein [Chitinophagales bacterium]|nr:DUF4199 domain-containing protein [Chitinophagales bacterium]
MSTNNTDHPISLREKGELNFKDTAIKFGIITGLVSIILSLVFYFINVEYDSWSRYVSILISMILVFIGVKNIAAENANKLISFVSLFKAGMLITLILAIISIVYFFIYTNFINTDFMDGLMQVQKEQMADKGLSEEKIETAMEMAQKFSSPIFMTITSFFTFIVIGAISSAIGAAIYKKEK